MSRSNSAAIRRRAQVPEEVSPTPVISSSKPDSRVLTTQEVIVALNNRISDLESKNSNNTQIDNTDYINQDQLNNIINDLNNKFNTLADEMDEIKNIVIKLQTFTMDVNKMLIDERIQMLSSIGNNDHLKITEENVRIDHDSINNSNNNSDHEN